MKGAAELVLAVLALILIVDCAIDCLDQIIRYQRDRARRRQADAIRAEADRHTAPNWRR